MSAKPPAWMAEGVCTGADPELFFPNSRDPHNAQRAKAICRTCPVRTKCLDYALTFEPHALWGVWGATTQHERRRMLHREAS